jgi:NAD(P)-dependent dehydrogenase (short-subunit alcohol dehydrogenase family)
MTIHRFKKKCFIVTGAADGIGLATTERLIREGASVAMLDLSEDKLLSAAEKFGEHAQAFTVDIASEEKIKQTFATAIEWLGELNGVVNAAGIVDFGHSHEYPLERWQRVIDVVLTGTFIVNKTAIPYLLKTNGAVVNVASIGGLRGKAWQAAYSAAKGGVLNLTRALACEYVGRIRFNTVAPGQVNNNIAMNSQIQVPPDGISDEEFLSEYGKRVMAPKGGGDSDDIAGVITFLLSDDAAYMEGSTVVVDRATIA